MLQKGIIVVHPLLHIITTVSDAKIFACRADLPLMRGCFSIS